MKKLTFIFKVQHHAQDFFQIKKIILGKSEYLLVHKKDLNVSLDHVSEKCFNRHNDFFNNVKSI